MTFTYNSDGWTPWVIHDGRGCPCEGYFVEVLRRNGATHQFIAGTGIMLADGRRVRRNGPIAPFRCLWSWAIPGDRSRRQHHILRYRVRRPDAAEALKALIADVPDEIPAMEGSAP